MTGLRVDDVAVVVGDVVVITAVGARVLGRALRAERDQARRNGADLGVVLGSILHTLEVAEARHEQRPVPLISSAVPHVDNGGSPPRPSDRIGDGPALSSVDVARLVGVSRRAVSKAARRGRLAGHLDRGKWTFTEQAVRRWRGQTAREK